MFYLGLVVGIIVVIVIVAGLIYDNFIDNKL